MINDELVTPPLGGSILPGITRDSVIQLARKWGLKVAEKPITIDEVIESSSNGTLSEAFGTGTAAVISPVGEFCYQDQTYVINGGQTGALSQRLFDELQAIQSGQLEDPFKWMTRVG
jgi:branched-chain amino acid aminotransferase